MPSTERRIRNFPLALLEVPRPGRLLVFPTGRRPPLEHSHDSAEVTLIDVQGEDFRVSLSVPGERGRPELVPPGRYRVQATRLQYARDDRPAWHELLGAAAEVVIRPGETARVHLQ